MPLTDLDTPLTLPCGVTLPNRILKSAMTEGLADARGRATNGHVLLYRRWAEGGAGTLVTGNVMIDGRFLERPGNVVIEVGAGKAALRRWAAAGTAAGNQLWMQISHPGRQCSGLVSRRPMAPSAVRVDIMGLFGRPVAMGEADIEDALERFAHVAEVARETGFTGVQIHAAHGYLVSQFLSPRLNRRTDRWGGALEGRSRFLLEAVARTRKAVGDDFPVAVKLNSSDFQKGGFSFAESLRVATRLEAAGVDLIEVSGGNYEQPSMFDLQGRSADAEPPLRESTRRREAFFLEYAAALRREITVPLAVTGGFRSRRSIGEVLAGGELDVVGLARPLVTEPDLPRLLLSGRTLGAKRHEECLRLGKGRLGPGSDIFLFKLLNAMGSLAWYYRQILRLADGRAPREDAAILQALLLHEIREIRLALARRRVLKRQAGGEDEVAREAAKYAKG